MGSAVYYSLPRRIRTTIHNALALPREKISLQAAPPRRVRPHAAAPIINRPVELQTVRRAPIIFVHIPKTGGISVASSLFAHQGGGHDGVWWYQLVFDSSDFDQYFKFTFVRNPWDRLVSAYTFLKKGGMNEQNRMWADRHLGRYDDFDGFVKGWVSRRNVYKGIHLIPQYEFVCPNNSVPLVDFVGHFERIDDDFRLIRDRLGVGGELQKLNTGTPKDYRKFYTEETKGIVADVYREDVEIFGYDFESSRYRQ